MQPAFQPARWPKLLWLTPFRATLLALFIISAVHNTHTAAAQCPVFSQLIEVSSLADAGPGSLRQAIEEANAGGGDAVVSFTIGGVIMPAGELPVLVANSVTIDAASAPDPGIVVDGGGLVSNGLLVEGSDVCVRGLTFQNFVQDGLRIRGENAQGIRVEEVISLDNGDDGLQVSEGATATLVANSSRGNGNKGLLVFAGGSVVADNNSFMGNGDGVTVSNGSLAVLLNNFIIDNDDNGIGLVSESQAEIRDNVIVNNGLVGPNSEGIRMTKSSEAEIVGNEIRGNGDKGVVVMGKSNADIVGNQVRGNVGDGILLAFSGDAVIDGNEIELNGGNGIRIVFKATADVGGGGRSAGGNSIQLNGGYEVINETANLISAVGNSWEEMTAAQLDAVEIHDDDEDSALGRVDFVPRLGEQDWDGDDSPDREDPCPHLAGVSPEALDLRGTQLINMEVEASGRGRVRFKGAITQTSLPFEPDGGGGFFLTVRQSDGEELAAVILPGGFPWVKRRGRNQWRYRIKGREGVRSHLREIGAPGNGRYRVSVDYKNVPLGNFPPSGLLSYSLEFVATDTCYYAMASRCWSAFIPPSTELCR